MFTFPSRSSLTRVFGSVSMTMNAEPLFSVILVITFSRNFESLESNTFCVMIASLRSSLVKSIDSALTIFSRGFSFGVIVVVYLSPRTSVTSLSKEEAEFELAQLINISPCLP
jgi:hypothetical protein